MINLAVILLAAAVVMLSVGLFTLNVALRAHIRATKAIALALKIHLEDHEEEARR